MSTIALDSARLFRIYERDAEEYCRSLPLEHFMESPIQSRQREITLESLAVVRAMWPEFQVFSELLIQYVLPGEEIERPVRVVPDNMVFVHPEPLKPHGSYMMPLQTIVPTLVLEYVSSGNQRKDYVDNRVKYEHELKVPYYLLFSGEKQELTVFRMVDEKYKEVKPNAKKRLAIPDLELEVAILDRWVRFWFRGELMPLPGDLLNSLNAERAARIKAEKSAKAAEKTAKAAEKSRDEERTSRLALETEIAQLRERLAKNGPPKAN